MQSTNDPFQRSLWLSDEKRKAKRIRHILYKEQGDVKCKEISSHWNHLKVKSENWGWWGGGAVTFLKPEKMLRVHLAPLSACAAMLSCCPWWPTWSSADRTQWPILDHIWPLWPLDSDKPRSQEITSHRASEKAVVRIALILEVFKIWDFFLIKNLEHFYRFHQLSIWNTSKSESECYAGAQEAWTFGAFWISEFWIRDVQFVCPDRNTNDEIFKGQSGHTEERPLYLLGAVWFDSFFSNIFPSLCHFICCLQSCFAVFFDVKHSLHAWCDSKS